MAGTTERGAPQGRGVVVGRFGGAPVVVRPGWLLTIVLLAVVSAPTAQAYLPGLSTAGAYAVGGAFGLLLLGSVLVHELAHAWMARRRGLQVHQIALTLVGGHTEMAGAAAPGTSALVAVAGPAANVVLAVLGWLGLQLVDYPGNPAAYAALAVLASSNALVAAFNLLPGLPMDGGHIFEALVWRVTGRRTTGTRAAAVLGRVVAVGLLVAAIGVPLARSATPDLTSTVWAVVIGFTLWTGAGSFLALAAWRDRVGELDLVRLARPAIASSARVLAELPDGAGGRGPEVVLVEEGRAIGYVDGAAFAEVPAAARPATPVGAVLVPLATGAVIDGTLRGEAALEAFVGATRSSPVVVVLGPAGDVVGLLRYADVAQMLRTMRRGPVRPPGDS